MGPFGSQVRPVQHPSGRGGRCVGQRFVQQNKHFAKKGGRGTKMKQNKEKKTEHEWGTNKAATATNKKECIAEKWTTYHKKRKMMGYEQIDAVAKTPMTPPNSSRLS